MPIDTLSSDFHSKCTCGLQSYHSSQTQRSMSVVSAASCSCDDCLRLRAGAYPPASPLIGHRSAVGVRGSARYPSSRRAAFG